MSKEDLVHGFTIAIGGIRITVACAQESLRFKHNRDYVPFLDSGKPEVRLYLHQADFALPKIKQTVFKSEGSWQLFRSNGSYIFGFYSPDYGQEPYKVAVMETDLSSGEIYSQDTDEEDLQLYNPLDYPLDEILMMHLLSKERGIMVHGSALEINGQGILFIGKSGSGKSTITNILMREEQNTVLNDDRIIIRKSDEKFWLYGTPWHGDIKECSAGKVPLRKIFFIKHGQENKIKSLSPAQKISRLIAQAFSTLWDKKGMEFSLYFCSELVTAIPAYELEFLPDKSIISFLKNQI